MLSLYTFENKTLDLFSALDIDAAPAHHSHESNRVKSRRPVSIARCPSA